MITVKRCGATITVEYGLRFDDEPPTWLFGFEKKFDHVWIAQAVEHEFRQGVEQRLRAIRKAAYEKGWRDAKQKLKGQRKNNRFQAGWAPEAVGWTE